MRLPHLAVMAAVGLTVAVVSVPTGQQATAAAGGAAPAVLGSPSGALAATTLPPFRSSVRRVTAKDLPHSWRKGCPVGPAKLRLVKLTFYGFDGEAHTGRLVVHRSVVKDVVSAFEKAYDKRFRIRRMHLVDRYDGSDARSMKADNTSAFNCRPIAGTKRWSRHAYGKAIDVNPRENPYVWRSHGVKHASPKAGKAYLDRSKRARGMLRATSTLVKALRAEDWEWGGSWRTVKDYQHLERP